MKLYFYYSAMNAGKTTLLLQSAFNYQERGMKTLLYTPEIDNRYGVGKISSRIGLSAEATTFDAKIDFEADVRAKLARDPLIKCVLVDEAQFLTRAQVLQLCRIVDTVRVPVLTYGLRTDFRGEPFEGSTYLLALADKASELKTICHCGRKAVMNLRLDGSGRVVRDGAQIQIGGNTSYVAVCRRHFMEEEPGPGFPDDPRGISRLTPISDTS